MAVDKRTVGIPEPTNDVDALWRTTQALKEAVEILQGVRGNRAALTADDVQNISVSDLSGSGGSGGIGVEVNNLSAAVTWVNVPDAFITQSSVTQHQGALSITESQISDHGTYLETVTAADVDSETSTDGYVLTSDGAGNAAWEIINDVALGARVTTAESDIASNVTDIGDLQTQINTLAESVAAEVYIQASEPVPGVGGVPDPIADAARWYDSDDNNHPYIYDQATTTWIDLEDPRIGQNAADITALDVRMDTAEGDITTNASAVSSLDTTVSTLSGTVTTNAADITQLESDLATTDGNVSANASAVSGLTTRVTTAEGNISTSASDITALDSRVTTAEGNITTNASAVSGLDTRVTTAEGNITTQSSYVTTLQSEMITAQGDIDAAEVTIGAQTIAISNAEGNITTLEAKYGVTLNVNGYITGFAQNNDGTTGEFVILADKFAIVDPAGNPGETEFIPFSVSGGVVTLQDVVINGNLIGGGQSAYNTGTGFWLGYDVDAYKFSIGNGTDQSLTWDGNTLEVKGDLKVGEYVASDTVILSADTERIDAGPLGILEKYKEFRIDRPGTIRVTVDYKCGVFSGGVSQVCNWEVRKNGSAVSAWNSSTDTTYTTKTVSPIAVDFNDLISIWMRGGERSPTEPIPVNAYIQNARIKATLVFNAGGSVVLD